MIDICTPHGKYACPYCEIFKLRAEVDKLREGLKNYGKHQGLSCNPHYGCVCGLDDLLRGEK